MQARLDDDGAVVRVEWPDGTGARFHAFWLRDNAQDPATRAPGNGQRLITHADIAPDLRACEARCDSGWLEVCFAGDATVARFSSRWLAARIYDRAQAALRDPGWLDEHIVTWGRELQDRVPSARFGEVASDRQALCRWLEYVRTQGLALLRDGPVRPGAVLEVASLFGYVRETNYGRLFDVRTEVNPSNLAFTSLGLPPHTDNPYRDPQPTLQILYCLENSASGGRSVVVDGFQACQILREETPAHFEVLSRCCARFEYAGSPGVRLRSRRPVIDLGPDGQLLAVRINNRSIAPIVDVPFDDMPLYYAAYRHLEAITNRESSRVAFALEPGECFIVDNTRVLHAREGYDAGNGKRWLQGCYADRDGLLSTLEASC